MIEKKIESIIKNLSLEDKAKLLVGNDFWHTYPFLGESGLCLTDGPHGLRIQTDGAKEVGLNESAPATCFPTASCLACSFDENLISRVGTAIAEECIDEKVDMLLGPGINIKRSPLCGRNFEYYSEDPFLSGVFASAFVKGVQKEGVFACLKHFACNNQEYARMVNDSIVDERALFEIYLKPFEIAIHKSSPKAIMCSYNKVNGIQVSHHSELLKKILREDFSFEGTTISDWGAVSNRVLSLQNGLDLEMPGSLSYYDIVSAVEKGNLSLETIDQAVRSVLKLYVNRPSFDQPKHKDHHFLAKQAALESIVLLKNEGNILPLHPSEKIGIVGNHAMRIQGAGSSKVHPKQVDSFLDCLSENHISYQVFSHITEEIQSMDKVLCFIELSAKNEIEGKDRSNLKLSEECLFMIEELKKLHSKIIVILTTGSVVELPFISTIPGLILTYLGGEASVSALCDILYNKTNPSGHLAESWIERLEDCPVQNYGKNVYQTFYKESIFVGYRYYDKVGIKPLFPFGYGLSYTTFELSDLHIKGKELFLTITNTGPYTGKEVIQLYVHDTNPNLLRPVRELKAFQKVEVASKESKTVVFMIEDSYFEYYDVSSHQFKISGGTYELQVGTSVQHIHQTVVYTVDSPVLTEEYNTYFDMKSIEDISKKDFEKIYRKDLPSKPKAYPFTLDTPMVEVQKKWIGRLFIHFGCKALKKRSQTEEEYEMNKYTFLTGPIRMIGMGMKKTTHQLEGIVDVLNGKIIRGLIRFLKKDKKADIHLKNAKNGI